MSSQTSPTLLTAIQVAEALNVKRGTVYRWASTGVLPSIRPHGTKTVRFRRSDVERLISGVQ